MILRIFCFYNYEILPDVLQLQQVYLLLQHLYLNSVKYWVFQLTWELSELLYIIRNVVGHFQNSIKLELSKSPIF